ncbi:zinc ABC transporter ATP-binding protein [Chromatiales bacterium (ex Bugula neritina AB1)]|nr:zinc ABC transporter ATP-binding protein [Chromatiales bacterium (ex Bugula neritina AB1)]
MMRFCAYQNRALNTNASLAVPSETLIDVHDLTVVNSGRRLVHGVNLSVNRGEIVTIVGPNGSGKSTTIKAILGILKPHSGKVIIDSRTRIGYVPQKLEVNSSLPITVDRFMRLTYRHRAPVIDAALNATGVSHLKKRELSLLSGGEFQRVLIARAMAAKPDVLVLDEPVQGVDFNAELEIYHLISELRRTHQCGVLLVSHDLHIVMAETDIVICMNGHVCCSGSPQVVTNSPEFRNLFGARGAEALAVYRHHHDHNHGPDGRVIPNSQAQPNSEDQPRV